MRCLSCNVILTDFEATRKSANTNDYLDLCNHCFYSISDDVESLERPDLEHEDGIFDDDSGVVDMDLELDIDPE